MKRKFDTLVLGGGGIKGIGLVGALAALDEIGIYKNIQTFIGTSAGAIVASLCARGYAIYHIKKIMATLNFVDFIDDKKGIVRDAWNILTRFGYCKGDKLLQWLQNPDKMSKDLTFGELPKELKVVATNLNTGVQVVKPLSPNDNVAEAVRASSCFPYFFRPVIDENGHYLVDGGILNNVPIDLAKNKETTLTIMLLSPDDMKIEKNARINNLKDFSFAILGTMLDTIQRTHIKQDDFDRAIKVICPSNIKTMDLYLSGADKQILFAEGYFAVRRWIEKNFSTD